MAANDRPADIQWLVSNVTDEITGYISRGREMGPPAFVQDGVLMGPTINASAAVAAGVVALNNECDDGTGTGIGTNISSTATITYSVVDTNRRLSVA